MVVNVGDPAARSRVTPAGDPRSWSPHGVIFFLPAGPDDLRDPLTFPDPCGRPVEQWEQEGPLGKVGCWI